ncbi:unnamed protein product [Blepharisma stoltei]|uniref:protein disulfide-isomerase n=1 Tax=Blepharisma stoltei TaxID=1481888 RepID=A0AAU9J780_9CILI|nr:unnamed protein product [Blepharisma stoltei]
MGLIQFIILPGILVLASFFDNTQVLVLDKDLFEEKVLKSTDIWFINFISSNDLRCERLLPKWNKAVEEYKGKVKFGVYDMTKDESIGSRYEITFYPTIKFFGADKSQLPQKFIPGKSFDDNLKEAYNYFTISQTSGNEKKDENARQIESKSSYNRPRQGNYPNLENGVWAYDDWQFEEKLLKDDKIWLVCFYKSNGEISLKLVQNLPKIALYFTGQINVATIDVLANPKSAEKYGINKFPSLELLPKEEKSASYHVESLISWEIISIVEKTYEEWQIQPKIPQLTSNFQLQDLCGKSLCMISFVPTLSNSNKENRIALLDFLHELSIPPKPKDVKFLWTEEGTYKELENLFGIQSYPSLVCISPKKSLFAKMKSSFSESKTREFYSSVLRGGVPVISYSSLPEIPTTNQWHNEFSVRWEGKCD